jgi:hypothetical protein
MPEEKEIENSETQTVPLNAHSPNAQFRDMHLIWG